MDVIPSVCVWESVCVSCCNIMVSKDDDENRDRSTTVCRHSCSPIICLCLTTSLSNCAHTLRTLLLVFRLICSLFSRDRPSCVPSFSRLTVAQYVRSHQHAENICLVYLYLRRYFVKPQMLCRHCSHLQTNGLSLVCSLVCTKPDNDKPHSIIIHKLVGPLYLLKLFSLSTKSLSNCICLLPLVAIPVVFLLKFLVEILRILTRD